MCWTHPLILCVALKCEASTWEDQLVQTPPGPPERRAGSSGQPAAFLRGDQESSGQAVGASAECGVPKGQELPPRSVTFASCWVFVVSMWWKWNAQEWTTERERRRFWRGQVLAVVWLSLGCVGGRTWHQDLCKPTVPVGKQDSVLQGSLNQEHVTTRLKQ